VQTVAQEVEEMGVTIKDIAKKAGVSPSTVSRVVNGNRVISEETRNKILKVMDQMQYHPNSLARKFANRSTYAIALVIDAEDEAAFSNTFFNRSLFAIERVALQNDYNLLITNDNRGDRSCIQSLVYEKHVDGLILPSSKIRKEVLEVLENENFPYVVLGEPPMRKHSLIWVDIDNHEGSRRAVNHLLEEGYQDIALVVKDQKNLFERKRLEGYRYAMNESGRNGNVMEYKEDRSLLEKEVLGFIEKQEGAFLCSNNVIAYEVMKILKDRKVKIPEEAGIVTFDNYPFAAYMDPPLTVVDINTYLLGERAANMLFEEIKKINGREKQILIETDLIVRDSSRRKGVVK